jgi:DNA-binding SARP family transcriptional activator
MQWPVAVKVAEDLVTLEPLRETAYGWLMRAQSGAGNRAEALRTYHRCREILGNELGVSPSRELSLVFDELLRASP